MVRVELGRELRIKLGDPGGVFVIPGACMSSRGSSSMVREPWSGDRGPWSASCEPGIEGRGPGIEGRGPGSKKRAGFAEAAAKARFHTLDAVQNSSCST